MKDLFLGIDLGTTNSVISYSQVLPNGNIKCNIIDVYRRSQDGGSERKATLPSVVYYQKDSNGNITPIVGDMAKSRYGTRYGYVCKSVKSLIGSCDEVGLNDEIPDKTPAEVSAQILKQLLTGLKSIGVKESIDDVVITVPASFDTNQCAATRDAARIAGINIDNIHEELLFEPKAAIFDFVHMQELGEIPNTLIDFTTPKNILVFDLGGGTLDVTLHKVTFETDNLPHIQDLAISRYTRIGGDDFDELLAEKMFERFQQQNGITVRQDRREEVLCKLRKTAETAKISLSNDYINAENMETSLPDDYDVHVMDMFLYDSYSYDDYFTPEEIEELLSPLLANDLNINDVDRIDKLPQNNIDNIIYPILDTLAKAKTNCGDCTVDAVIMNGGMTKFYPIKKRIDKFFSLESITQNDPDLAVARGASYYHYLLHKYKKEKSSFNASQIVGMAVTEPEAKIQSYDEKSSDFDDSTILNDTICLGIKGEYILKLVEAGTKLPYVSPVFSDKLITSEYANSFAAEVFLGRGSNKNLPNRRIATKEIAFNQPLKRGTRISCQVAVSAMRDITLAFWIGNDSNSNQQFTVDNSLKTNTLRHLHRLDTVQPKTLNAKSEIHILKTLAGHRLKNRNAVNDKQNNAKINNQISRIITADNPSDFYEEVYSEIESAKNDTPYKGYMYRIAKSFHPYWSDSQNNSILRICKSHFSDMAYQFHQDGYMLSQALIYIFLCDEDGKQFCMEMCDDANRKRSVYECFSRLNAEDLPLNKIDDYNVICERIGFSSESN